MLFLIKKLLDNVPFESNNNLHKIRIMKIIAVNISKTIDDNGPKQATKRAWKLNIKRAEKCDFIIGINKKERHIFKILSVKKDEIHNDRIGFNIDDCSILESDKIEEYIKIHNFKYVTTKYIE